MSSSYSSAVPTLGVVNNLIAQTQTALTRTALWTRTDPVVTVTIGWHRALDVGQWSQDDPTGITNRSGSFMSVTESGLYRLTYYVRTYYAADTGLYAGWRLDTDNVSAPDDLVANTGNTRWSKQADAQIVHVGRLEANKPFIAWVYSDRPTQQSGDMSWMLIERLR